MSSFGFGYTSGYTIITSPMMGDRRQVRFPRSKKKRIRKKWRKNPKYWATIPWEKAVRQGNVLIMHPILAQRMRDAIAAADVLIANK